MSTTIQTNKAIAEAIAFLEDPPQRYIKKEEAISFILFSLLAKPCCYTEILSGLSHVGLLASDTIVTLALRQLEKEEAVYRLETVKIGGRGRSRIMYALVDDYRAEALKVAALWVEYLKKGA